MSIEPYSKITPMPIVAPGAVGGEFVRVAGFTVRLAGRRLITNNVVVSTNSAQRIGNSGQQEGSAHPSASLEDVVGRELRRRINPSSPQTT